MSNNPEFEKACSREQFEKALDAAAIACCDIARLSDKGKYRKYFRNSIAASLRTVVEGMEREYAKFTQDGIQEAARLTVKAELERDRMRELLELARKEWGSLVVPRPDGSLRRPKTEDTGRFMDWLTQIRGSLSSAATGEEMSKADKIVVRECHINVFQEDIRRMRDGGYI